MACQECSKVYCGNCNGPKDIFGFNYKAIQRKKRRQTIHEKKVGKYSNTQMIGCQECGTLNCTHNMCSWCTWIYCI